MIDAQHPSQSKNPRYTIGVDLGQAQDFTAIVILESYTRATGEVMTRTEPVSRIYSPDRPPGPSHRTITTPVTENHHHCRHLERLPIGTPYPQQVARIRALYTHLKRTAESVRLVVDQTGVGRPVVDMLRASSLGPIAVTITGGDSVTHDDSGYRVPKRDLVSTVQVLLQAKRLKIASSLPEAQNLIQELLAFKVSISLKGHDSYGNDVGTWREAPHDDLVLAAALACWQAERFNGDPRPVYRSRQRIYSR